MSRTFSIRKDYYDLGFDLFESCRVKFEPGISVLVGCNGAGKSTLIKALEGKLKKVKSAVCVKYNDLTEGGVKSADKAMFYGNVELAIALSLSSEGEAMRRNVGSVFAKVGTALREKPDAKEVWILLDAVDSGFSIDNVVELKDAISLVIEKSEGRDVYVIISANGFEFARGEDCINVADFSHVRFNDYEDYREFVLASRKRRDAKDAG